MNNYTVNFTTPEESTNSTTDSFWLLKSLQISIVSINLLFGFPTHCYIIWLIITGTGSGVASEFFILNLSVCLSITGRPVFQCLICVERYLAVVQPVTFLKALKQTGPGERKREREEENHMKRRAFQIILITT
ncbi:hypothetical protein F2P79_020881, partial [Pimephales promelas]